MSATGAGEAEAPTSQATVANPVEVSAAPTDTTQSQELIVRSASPEDAPGVCDLVKRWADSGRLLPRTLREVESLIECFVVVRLGNDVVGCAHRVR